MKRHIYILSKLLFLCISIIILSSCDKDGLSLEANNNLNNTGNRATNNETNRLEKVLTTKTITTNINATVVDENNSFVSNAILKIGNTINTTNANGYVLIENIEVNEHFQVIKTESNGYTTSIKTITPSNNGVTNITITLLKPNFEESFDANEGGTVSNNEVAIQFPSDAIADQNGDLYEGEVTTTVTYYNPNAASFSATIPGTLVGLDNNNSMQALISKGMIKVNLTDGAGNELEIFEGKEATIILPAGNNDPETIDFWHLNEEKGIWVQTGTATKVDDAYIATVTHFSTYNLDVKVNPIDIDFIIKDSEGNFIANEEAEITATLNGDTYNIKITTDNKGAFTIINAPQNAEYVISFLKCEESLIVSAGVISESTTKELFVDALNSARFIKLEGILYGCNDDVLSNKVFIIEIENNGVTDRITTYANSNGVYSTTSWLCNYDTTTTYQTQIRVFDGDNDIVTDTELVFDTNYTFKNIIVCNGTIEPVPERVYEGDFIINSDQKLEEFAAAGYNRITGILKIENLTTATNLKSLKSLSIVGDYVEIKNNESLVSLEGLENLTTILYGKADVDLWINNNPNLINLQGFDKLKGANVFVYGNDNLVSINGIEKIDFSENALIIEVNKSLTDVTAFNSFTEFGSINISSNERLKDLSSLKSITKINSLSLRSSNLITNLDFLSNIEELNSLTINNLSLTSLEGLPNLEKLYSLSIRNNYLLTDLSAISSITELNDLYIYSNNSLTDLDDLSNLETLTYLSISYNSSLTNYCGLNIDMISNLNYFSIHNNSYNPTKQNLLNGDCSQ